MGVEETEVNFQGLRDVRLKPVEGNCLNPPLESVVPPTIACITEHLNGDGDTEVYWTN